MHVRQLFIFILNAVSIRAHQTRSARHMTQMRQRVVTLEMVIPRVLSIWGWGRLGRWIHVALEIWLDTIALIYVIDRPRGGAFRPARNREFRRALQFRLIHIQAVHFVSAIPGETF